MEKTKIEFINTCPCCDGLGDILRDIEKRFSDKIDLSIYYVGKDFGYIPKYGVIMRGTMIINEKDVYEEPNRRQIEQAVSKAIGVAL